jgi:L-alanine-DL-glutamate epimerase-like enolase superfamily enzyme
MGALGMKITALETLLIDEFPNLTYVLVHTDEGISGLGETYFGAQAVAAWVHETAAPYLLGRDPLQIDRHRRGLNPCMTAAGRSSSRRSCISPSVRPMPWCRSRYAHTTRAGTGSW